MCHVSGHKCKSHSEETDSWHGDCAMSVRNPDPPLGGGEPGVSGPISAPTTNENGVCDAEKPKPEHREYSDHSWTKEDDGRLKDRGEAGTRGAGNTGPESSRAGMRGPRLPPWPGPPNRPPPPKARLFSVSNSAKSSVQNPGCFRKHPTLFLQEGYFVSLRDGC